MALPTKSHSNVSKRSQEMRLPLTIIFSTFWLILTANHVFCSTANSDIGSSLQNTMIWLEGKPAPKQVYCVFRREFNLSQQPAQAKLHIFADSRYILWVNGSYVDRGPCRFDPRYPEYDTLDIQEFLQPGSNVIAVLVHNYYGAVNGRIMQRYEH